MLRQARRMMVTEVYMRKHDSDIVGNQPARKKNEVNRDSEETDNERGEVENM